jgi:hypothetical protein
MLIDASKHILMGCAGFPDIIVPVVVGLNVEVIGDNLGLFLFLRVLLNVPNHADSVDI